MANTEISGTWEKIRRNVQETERLIGQKKYNLSMVRARQTLEYMVKCQCDKAGIVEGPMDAMIKELYAGRWITKLTAERYLQILSLGNKAVKEGNDSAYDAEQAYHLLAEEVHSFADEPRREHQQRSRPAPERGERSDQRERSEHSRSRAPVRSRKKQSRSALNPADLLKLLIPIVLIIVLVFLIRILTPKKSPTDETTVAPTTVEETTMQPSTEVPTTAEPETTAPPVSYKTTTTLNVRQSPDQTSTKIGKLDPDVTVEYVRDENEQWAVILYNGIEAYVSKEYLKAATE